MVNHLYIHVPFCKSICHYCDFCHRLYDEKIVDEWLKELEKEINSKNINRQLKTIYLGGGTPSCLNLAQLDRLFSLIDPYRNEAEEYTVEVNPETIDEDKVNLLVKHGVNRVSIGIQSFDDNILKLLNRSHTKGDVLNCIKIFRDAGITNITCDLMYSLPSQTLKVFLDDLKQLVYLNIPHISFYSLTIEENSVFGKKGYKPLDEDIEAEMYEEAYNYLNTNGYVQYEVSNYCMKGFESKHNLGYWNYDDFYGISLGASGKENNIRYDNTRLFRDYFNHEYIKETYVLTKEDLMFENIMMSLRLIDGLNMKEFERRYGVSVLEAYPQIGDMIKHGELETSGKMLKCVNRELLNSTLVKLM